MSFHVLGFWLIFFNLGAPKKTQGSFLLILTYIQMKFFFFLWLIQSLFLGQSFFLVQGQIHKKPKRQKKKKNGKISILRCSKIIFIIFLIFTRKLISFTLRKTICWWALWWVTLLVGLKIYDSIHCGGVRPPHTHTNKIRLSWVWDKLIVRVQFRQSVEWGVPLQCHYSHVHADLEW